MIQTCEKTVTGTLKILGKEGDRRIIWRSNSIPEISEARKVFRDALAQGCMAFLSKKGGSKGTKITEFDAEAEEIILVPPVIGG